MIRKAGLAEAEAEAVHLPPRLPSAALLAPRALLPEEPVACGKRR